MKRRDIEQQLLHDWDWFLDFGSALDDEILAYEVTPDGHDPSIWWTVKDHIVHVYAISRRANDLVKGLAAGAGGYNIDFDAPVEELMKRVDETTHAVMVEHRDHTWSEVIALGQRTKAERLELLASLTDEQLETPAPPPYGQMDGGDGTLGNLLISDGRHQRMHLGLLR